MIYICKQTHTWSIFQQLNFLVNLGITFFSLAHFLNYSFDWIAVRSVWRIFLQALVHQIFQRSGDRFLHNWSKWWGDSCFNLLYYFWKWGINKQITLQYFKNLIFWIKWCANWEKRILAYSWHIMYSCFKIIFHFIRWK